LVFVSAFFLPRSRARRAMVDDAPPLLCTRRQDDAPWSTASSSASSPFKESSQKRRQRQPQPLLHLWSPAKSGRPGPPPTSLSTHANFRWACAPFPLSSTFFLCPHVAVLVVPRSTPPWTKASEIVCAAGRSFLTPNTRHRLHEDHASLFPQSSICSASPSAPRVDNLIPNLVRSRAPSLRPCWVSVSSGKVPMFITV
jgi:hypothetical protein